MKTLLTLALCGTLSLNTAHTQEPLSLRECMIYAVENSFDAKIQQEATRNSHLDYKKALLSHLPSLSAGVGANTSFGRSIDPATNTYSTVSTFSNSLSASASMTIFAGFRMMNQTRSTKIAHERGLDELQNTRDQIALETMVLFSEALYYEELVKLNSGLVDQYTQQEMLMKRKSELGVGSDADLAQVRAALASAQYQLISAQKTYDLSLMRLKDYINYPSEKTLQIAPFADSTSLYNAEENSQGVIEYATKNNIKAQIQEKTLEMEKLALKITKGYHVPSLSFSAGIGSSYYTQFGTNGHSPYSEQLNNNLGESLGLSLSIPVFNGLNTRYSVRQSENRLRQANHNFQKQIRALESEVRAAILELESSEKALSEARRNVEFQRLANRAVSQKYDKGIASIIDLQTSNNDLLRAELELRNSYLLHQLKVREVNYYKGVPYIE